MKPTSELECWLFDLADRLERLEHQVQALSAALSCPPPSRPTIAPDTQEDVKKARNP